MTGLEKIVEQIKQEAKIASEKELAKTREEVEQLLEEGKKERESFKAAFLTETDSQVELLLKRGEAAAVLQRKKSLLKEKQEIIHQVVENARESLLNLSEKEYFALLLKMLHRYAKNGKCSILLSPRDKMRAPKDFLSELMSRSIVLAGESEKIDGGFILVYGDIEENCSFEALFAASKEVLQDKIGALVFSNAGAGMER